MLANALSLEVGSRGEIGASSHFASCCGIWTRRARPAASAAGCAESAGSSISESNFSPRKAAGHERESPPQFTAADLLIESGYSRPNQNSGDVIYLIDELRNDRKLCQEAADILNDAWTTPSWR